MHSQQDFDSSFTKVSSHIVEVVSTKGQPQGGRTNKGDVCNKLCAHILYLAKKSRKWPPP